MTNKGKFYSTDTFTWNFDGEGNPVKKGPVNVSFTFADAVSHYINVTVSRKGVSSVTSATAEVWPS